MKKFLLTLSAIVMSAGAFSQITVNSTDLVGWYDQFDQGRDTAVTGIVPGAAGPNQTYNFSGLTSHFTSHVTVTNPVWTDSGYAFPTSSLASRIIDATDDTTWLYMTKNTTGLWIDGLVGELGLAGAGIDGLLLKNDDPELYVNLPLNYNDSYADDAKIDVTEANVTFNGNTYDSVRAVQYHDRSYIVDGWGTATTPLGTFDVLRQRVVDYEKDTVWVYDGSFGWFQALTIEDSTFSYQYWSNDPAAGFPVAELTVDHQDNVEEANWLMVTPLPTSVKEEALTFSVYPNPVQDRMKINSSIIADRISITDITGKVVMTRRQFESGYLNTSGLKSGVYFISLYADDQVKTQKFVKH